MFDEIKTQTMSHHRSHLCFVCIRSFESWLFALPFHPSHIITITARRSLTRTSIFPTDGIVYNSSATPNFARNKADREKRIRGLRRVTSKARGSIRTETNETVTRLRAGLRGRSPTPPHFADSSSGRHHISPRKNGRLPASAKLRDRQPRWNCLL